MGVGWRNLVEVVVPFAGGGGIVPRKAVGCSRLKAGQVVGGLAFFFWRGRGDCRVWRFVL